MATNQFFEATNSAMPLIPKFNAVGSVGILEIEARPRMIDVPLRKNISRMDLYAPLSSVCLLRSRIKNYMLVKYK